jgi:LuxR family maltose regulon positive regulatory protein
VLTKRASITENRHRWYVVMAQVSAAKGDHDAAALLLDQAEDLYRPGFYPDVRPIPALRARVRITGGDLDAADEWVKDRAVSVDDEPDYLREYEHLTLARLLLARHPADQRTGGASVLGLLDRLYAAALTTRRDGSVREIRMLQALAYQARGDLTRALEALGRSFADTPEPESHVRLYLDEGAPMLALLHHAAAADRPASPETTRSGLDVDGDDVRAHARRLLELLRPSRRWASRSRARATC